MSYNCYKLVDITPEELLEETSVSDGVMVFENAGDDEYYIYTADYAKLPPEVQAKCSAITIGTAANEATAGSSPVIKKRKMFV